MNIMKKILKHLGLWETNNKNQYLRNHRFLVIKWDLNLQVGFGMFLHAKNRGLCQVMRI